VIAATFKASQIVGLVNNTKYGALREEFRPIAFMPLSQEPRTPGSINLMVRMRGPLNNVMSSVRRQMAEVDPQPLIEFRVLDVEIRDSLLRERLMAKWRLLAVCWQSPVSSPPSSRPAVPSGCAVVALRDE